MQLAHHLLASQLVNLSGEARFMGIKLVLLSSAPSK
jgi:hypothetical protein